MKLDEKTNIYKKIIVLYNYQSGCNILDAFFVCFEMLFMMNVTFFAFLGGCHVKSVEIGCFDSISFGSYCFFIFFDDIMYTIPCN